MYTSVDSAWDLAKSKYAIALGVRDKATDEFKSDHSIVRWEAMLIEGDGVKRKDVLQTIELHQCNQGDWN